MDIEKQSTSKSNHNHNKVINLPSWQLIEDYYKLDLSIIPQLNQIHKKYPKNKFLKKGMELVIIKLNNPNTDSAFQDTKIRSPISGKLLKLDYDEIIIEKCGHGMTYGGLCVDCGEKYDNKNSYVTMSKSVAFSSDKAKEIEDAFIEKAKKNKKLILVLDIDNTILHSIDEPLYNKWTEKYKLYKDKKLKNTLNKEDNENNSIIKDNINNDHEYKENKIEINETNDSNIDKEVEIEIEKNSSSFIEKAVDNNLTSEDQKEVINSKTDLDINTNIKNINKSTIVSQYLKITEENVKQNDETIIDIVKERTFQSLILPDKRNKAVVTFRPGIIDFLNKVSQNYDIYLYTMGIEQYALSVLEYINKQLNRELFSAKNMIARDSAINDKGLQKCITKICPNNQDYCLILDDRDDVWLDSSYLIKIAPFFFKFRKQYDCFLELSQLMLQYVHDVFFSLHEKDKYLAAHIILEKTKKLVFNRTVLLFVNVKKEICDHYSQIITELGGSISLKYTEEVNICLIGDDTTDELINNAFDDCICVHSFYISYCSLFYYKLDASRFRFKRDNIFNHEALLRDIYSEEFTSIINFYSLKCLKDNMNDYDKDNANSNSSSIISIDYYYSFC